MKKSVPDTQLLILQKSLENISPAKFELLSANLMSKLLGDISVVVSKSGAQYGGDGGTSAYGGRHVRIECKRYRQKTPLGRRQLAGEILESIQRDPFLEVWVLWATKSVLEPERDLARDTARSLGIGIVIIDWSEKPAGNGINDLAATCAEWPEIVGQYLGEDAEKAARALKSVAGESVSTLIRQLKRENLAFNGLREKSLEYLASIWEDSSASKAAINQDAAGGKCGVHLLERLGPLGELDSWFVNPSKVRSPAVVTGIEGMGKTWVVLDWLIRRKESIPIVLVIGANEFVGMNYLNEGGVKDLLIKKLRHLTGMNYGDDYWRRRLESILGGPASDQLAFLVFVDGLNQHPDEAWTAVAQAFQSPHFSGKLRLITTIRDSYFEDQLVSFRDLSVSCTRIRVATYTSFELDTLLALHKIVEIPVKLRNLASSPRLFSLVVRLKDNSALLSEATETRLLFEYSREFYGASAGTLTHEQWVEYLKGMARNYLAKNSGDSYQKSMTSREVKAVLADSQISSTNISRLLGEIRDTGVVTLERHPSGDRVRLKDEHALLGLSLVLLEEISGEELSSPEKIENKLANWLDPIRAIDRVTLVLRSALSILSIFPDQDGRHASGVILNEWINAQNPSAGFSQDARTFGESFPISMLYVIEKSGISPRSIATHHAIQAVRSVPRTDSKWEEIMERLLKWCGFITLPDKRHVSDDTHYAKRQHERLIERIGIATPSTIQVLGEVFTLTEERNEGPASAIPAILEGHKLSDFKKIFRRAAVNEAISVENRSGCWTGLRWLVILESDTGSPFSNELKIMSDEILLTAEEEKIDPEIKGRAAARLLRMSGETAHGVRAMTFESSQKNRWNYEVDYLENPMESVFSFEHRHLKEYMFNEKYAVERRLSKMKAFLGDPSLSLPKDLADDIREKLKKQKFNDMDARGYSNDPNYLSAELFGAQFLSLELASATHRRIKSLSKKKHHAKYWAALAINELSLLIDPSEGSMFNHLRVRENAGQHEAMANSWCLIAELLKLPLQGQLDLLKSATGFNFYTDLMAVVHHASATELEDFLNRHDEAKEAARVVLEVMAYQESIDVQSLSNRLVKYLDATDDELLRSIAFVALSICAPEICGQYLMARKWSANRDDLYYSHYGSVAIAHTSMHLPLGDVLGIIAPAKWLAAVAIRGGNKDEFFIASSMLLQVMDASRPGLPAYAGDLSMTAGSNGELARITISEPSNNTSDGIKALFRASESSEKADKRLQELAQQASASIQNVRLSGNKLFLQLFPQEEVKSAYHACPNVWLKMLDGIDEGHTEFIYRLHAAEGLFLALCEVLLEASPALGRQLWHSLRKNLRTKILGHAGISELRHIIFRVNSSPEVLALREDATSLKLCNTDEDLFEIYIAARINRQDEWLNDFINSDKISKETWKKYRSITMNGFATAINLDEMKWPQGSKFSLEEELTDRMQLWANRTTLSEYWWKKFCYAKSSHEAFSAWKLFLSLANRSSAIWKTNAPVFEKPLNGLSRLKRIHCTLTSQQLSSAMKRLEGKNPSFENHLFGMEAPSEWLSLDGKIYR